jgi:hypothetical protein
MSGRTMLTLFSRSIRKRQFTNFGSRFLGLPGKSLGVKKPRRAVGHCRLLTSGVVGEAEFGFSRSTKVALIPDLLDQG